MCATHAVALPAFIAAFNNSVLGGKRQKREGKDVVKSGTQQHRHTAAAERQRVKALILTFRFGASCWENFTLTNHRIRSLEVFNKKKKKSCHTYILSPVFTATC